MGPSRSGLATGPSYRVHEDEGVWGRGRTEHHDSRTPYPYDPSFYPSFRPPPPTSQEYTKFGICDGDGIG